MTEHSAVETPESETDRGRRILLGVGAVVVVLAGILGFFAGSNGAETVPTLRLFGLVAVPTTPATLALYGMAVAVLALAGLFGLVTLASRFDDERA